jgi:hypothetical protein
MGVWAQTSALRLTVYEILDVFLFEKRVERSFPKKSASDDYIWGARG